MDLCWEYEKILQYADVVESNKTMMDTSEKECRESYHSSRCASSSIDTERAGDNQTRITQQFLWQRGSDHNASFLSFASDTETGRSP